jgi:RNA polymerase sigma-70 factor (ECF subfamily)
VRTLALESLRGYLLRALPGCLRRYGEVPAHLLEDAVQDALIRALGELDRFEGRSLFTTWVTTIAVRVALTELRRRRWRDVSLEALTASAEMAPQPLADLKPDPGWKAAQLGLEASGFDASEIRAAFP